MLLLIVFYFFQPQRPPVWLSTAVLTLEIVLLNVLIGMHGASTNPFAIVLLAPLVIGLVQLPFWPALTVLILSITGQLIQLLPDIQGQSGMMRDHASSMIIGFVVTSLLLSAIISYFRWQLTKSASALQALREKQLRDEQLLAIGTAAAQLTHDAASPVQTIRLLLEELEAGQAPELMCDINEQVLRLETLLNNWRAVADDVRESRVRQYASLQLLKELRYSLVLARPEACISWPAQPANVWITADRTLLPALTSIIINACESDSSAADVPVSLYTKTTEKKWTLTIVNPITNDNDMMKLQLGSRLQASAKGSGVGAVLSNASIERLGGSVLWHVKETGSQQQCCTQISLPATHHENHCDHR